MDALGLGGELVDDRGVAVVLAALGALDDAILAAAFSTPIRVFCRVAGWRLLRSFRLLAGILGVAAREGWRVSGRFGGVERRHLVARRTRAEFTPINSRWESNPGGAFGCLAGSQRRKPMEPEEERAAAEIRRLNAEATKLTAETDKLDAEARKLRHRTITNDATFALAAFTADLAGIEFAKRMGWL